MNVILTLSSVEHSTVLTTSSLLILSIGAAVTLALFHLDIIQLSIVFGIVRFYMITKSELPLLVSLTEELLLPDHLRVADCEDSVDTNHVGLSFNNGQR